MHGERRWKLISYDIRDAKRYRRVFKILKGYGHAVQYSVFRACLDDRSLEQLRWRLEKELAPEDSLLIIDLCPRCANRVRVRNRPNDWAALPASFLVATSQALERDLGGSNNTDPDSSDS
jgi:CRISPR-associated protein Cas2